MEKIVDIMPLELEDYGSFVTGPIIIDLEDVIYVSEVQKYVSAYSHVRTWYLEYQMYGVSAVQKIECEEKRSRTWHLFFAATGTCGKNISVAGNSRPICTNKSTEKIGPYRVIQVEC